MLRTRSLAVTVTVAGLLLTAACGSGTTGTTTDSAGTLVADDVAMAQPARHTSYPGLRTGMRALGYAVLGEMPPERGKGGVVVSPASLALAFSMLREGARGRTAASIDRVIRLPRQRHEAMNDLVHALNHTKGGNTVDVNDGLFIDPRFQVRSSYLATIKKWYGAGVHVADFPHDAVEEINHWVAENTHGRIKKLLDQLPSRAGMALVNTIYLDARWESRFSAEDTHDEQFTTAGGAATQVKMMHRDGTLDYAHGDGWQAVRLPYRGDALSMWVLLPENRGSDPLALLSPKVLRAAGQGFTARTVELSLPRWKARTTVPLTQILTDLGMTHVFGSGDYSGLARGPVSVDSAVQQATIDVAEKGTVAAAATSVVGLVGAAPPADQVTFTADHPFAFAVIHERTGVPLFEGVVHDPS